jgi:uncharacterized protein (TIGR02452 family)
MLVIAARKATREQWAAIAEETRRIVLGDGKYIEERPISTSSPLGALERRLVIEKPGEPSMMRIAHDISAQVLLSTQGTTFYPHYSDSLAHWPASSRRVMSSAPGTIFDFMHCSTVTAARRLIFQSTSDSTSPTIGALSFSSPKKPGGGYLHGGDEQEEVLARLSSLVSSLSSPAAQGFYKEHRKSRTEDGSGLHDHSMVYSPGVVVFRADANDDTGTSHNAAGGAFISPFTVNILSAVPVNAAAVRSKHVILPSERQFFEEGISTVAKERMARVLRVFEERGDRTLILGAFGCSSSQNNVEVIASIWAELLVCGSSSGAARFKDVFDRVVFAVPGKHFAKFKEAFEMRIFESEVAKAALSD